MPMPQRAKLSCLKIEQKCRSAVSGKVNKVLNNCMGLMDEIFAVRNGTGTAHGKNGHAMKRNQQILKRRTRFSLGDLILAVSSCTNSNRETVAAVADLLASGQVRVHDNGRFLRARVC
jgi:aconitase A